MSAHKKSLQSYYPQKLADIQARLLEQSYIWCSSLSGSLDRDKLSICMTEIIQLQKQIWSYWEKWLSVLSVSSALQK